MVLASGIELVLTARCVGAAIEAHKVPSVLESITCWDNTGAALIDPQHTFEDEEGLIETYKMTLNGKEAWSPTTVCSWRSLAGLTTLIKATIDGILPCEVE